MKIELSKIEVPANPRTDFINTPEFAELKKSINVHGILIPVVVVKTAPNKYLLVDGERRLKAATINNMTEVPVVEIDSAAIYENNVYMHKVIEHMQRADLSTLDKILVINELSKSKKRKEIKSLVGVSDLIINKAIYIAGIFEKADSQEGTFPKVEFIKERCKDNTVDIKQAWLICQLVDSGNVNKIESLFSQTTNGFVAFSEKTLQDMLSRTGIILNNTTVFDYQKTCTKCPMRIRDESIFGDVDLCTNKECNQAKIIEQLLSIFDSIKEKYPDKVIKFTGPYGLVKDLESNMKDYRASWEHFTENNNSDADNADLILLNINAIKNGKVEDTDEVVFMKFLKTNFRLNTPEEIKAKASVSITDYYPDLTKEVYTEFLDDAPINIGPENAAELVNVLRNNLFNDYIGKNTNDLSDIEWQYLIDNSIEFQDCISGYATFRSINDDGYDPGDGHMVFANFIESGYTESNKIRFGIVHEITENFYFGIDPENAETIYFKKVLGKRFKYVTDLLAKVKEIQKQKLVKVKQELNDIMNEILDQVTKKKVKLDQELSAKTIEIISEVIDKYEAPANNSWANSFKYSGLDKKVKFFLGWYEECKRSKE